MSGEAWASGDPNAAGSPSRHEESLRSLKQLRDTGVISQAEYEAKVLKLAEQVNGPGSSPAPMGEGRCTSTQIGEMRTSGMSDSAIGSACNSR